MGTATPPSAPSTKRRRCCAAGTSSTAGAAARGTSRPILEKKQKAPFLTNIAYMPAEVKNTNQPTLEKNAKESVSERPGLKNPYKPLREVWFLSMVTSLRKVSIKIYKGLLGKKNK